MSSTPLTMPDLGALRSLADDDLMMLQRQLGELRRQVDAGFARVAGEVARRSSAGLGFEGLAQRTGARTPERLVARLTGVTSTEARSMVSVGEALDGAVPWLAAVTERVSTGELGVGAAAAIRAGLGEPTNSVGAQELARAAELLASRAGDLPAEKVVQHARAARDELDATGIADREAVLRSRRYLRLVPTGDGMTRITGLLDPESVALVTDAFDRVTAPRRGGVRFVDPAERARAEAIAADERTTEQLAVDAFVNMVRVAGEHDGGAIFGRTAPSVRVHVRLSDLQSGTGAGFAEGQSSALSIGTVHRLICQGGVVPILFDDDGRAMNAGRTKRLHTSRQRVAIGARDGGCTVRDCDRPPGWTEVHHIDEWTARRGETSVDDGISLCAHHHRWVHDVGARIVRRGVRYVLTRRGHPDEPLTSKSPVARAARHAA